MTKYTLGQIVTVDGAFRAWNGTAYELADPTSLTLRLARPGGAQVTQDFGDPMVDPFIAIVNTGVGTYYADVKPDVDGRWIWRWEATGIAEGAGEGDFDVESMLNTALVILKAPDDYDAIRNLLGVTELDLTDNVIDSPVFAPAAEAEIKTRVEDWATIYDDADGERQLRVATSYLTAASIARTMANGGFVGLMHPDQNRNWSEEAAMLDGYAEEWINLASPDSTDFELPMMRLAHARSDSDDTARAAPDWADGFPAQWAGWLG